MSDNITYSDARNPKWANTAQTAITLEVMFDHLPSDPWVDCLVKPTGDLPHCHQLYAAAVNGDFGTISAYEPEVISGDEAMEILRSRRGELLKETDHWAYQDTPDMTTEQITYRQELRDLPANSSGATLTLEEGQMPAWSGVTWPTKP